MYVLVIEVCYLSCFCFYDLKRNFAYDDDNKTVEGIKSIFWATDFSNLSASSFPATRYDI